MENAVLTVRKVPFRHRLQMSSVWWYGRSHRRRLHVADLSLVIGRGDNPGQPSPEDSWRIVPIALGQNCFSLLVDAKTLETENWAIEEPTHAVGSRR
jgi:hypothetical protein